MGTEWNSGTKKVVWNSGTDFSKLVIGEPKYGISRNVEHIYYVDGIRQPSVTQILHSELGIDYYHDTDFYRDRGSEVDRCCGLLIKDDLVWDSVDERVKPFVAQFKAFIDNTGFVPLLDHAYVYNPASGYAGELDLFGYFRQNPKLGVLLDLKCGAKRPHYALQTWLYSEALCSTYESLKNHLWAGEIDRFCLYLGTDKYRLDHHKNKRSDAMYGESIVLAHKAKGIYS